MTHMNKKHTDPQNKYTHIYIYILYILSCTFHISSICAVHRHIQPLTYRHNKIAFAPIYMFFFCYSR